MKKFFQLNHQRFIIFSIIAVIFLSLAMPSPAKAGILGDIISFPFKIIMAAVVFIISVGLGLIQIASAVLVYLAATAVRWIITAPVLLTHGGVVDAGWQFSRDIANMLFIVVLLVIAFATMLKLEIYAAKKTLVTFIIIALLINFSQVIAGVIVDISNVLMSFFVSRGAADAGQTLVNQNVFLGDFLGIGKEGFWNTMVNIFSSSFPDFVAWCLMMIMKGLAGIIFNLVEWLILSLYEIVLVLRIVMIWILVILAPLAWLGRILPATKSWWDSWWKSFTQWAFIGVPLLFFLYLTGFLLQNTANIDIFKSCTADFKVIGATEASVSAGAQFLAWFFCTTLPSIVAIVMLFLGLSMGFSFIGGAPGIVNSIMQKPVKAVGEAAKWGALGYAFSAGGKVSKEGKVIRPSYAQSAINKFAKVPFVGLPAARMLSQQMAQARAKTGGGLETLSNDTLGTMLKQRGTNAFTKAAIIGMFAERLNKKEISFKEITNILTPQMVALAKQLGILNLGILGLRDPLKYGMVALGKAPKEIIKEMGADNYREMRIGKMKDEDKDAFIENIFNVTNASNARQTFNMDMPEDIQALAESVDEAIQNTPLVAELAEINNTAAGGTGEVGAGRLANLIESKPIAKQGELKNQIRDVLFNYFNANKPRGLTEEGEPAIRRYSDMILEGLINRHAVVTKGVTPGATS